MKLRNARAAKAVSLILTCCVAASCGKKSSDTTPATVAKDDKPTDTTDTPPSAINVLASAFPSALALSAFPTAGSSLALAEEEEVADPNADKDFKEKVADTKKVLAGTAEHCLDPHVFAPHPDFSDVTCYQFDSDMNPSRYAQGGGPSPKDFGTIDGTDGKGEACMVTFARAEVSDVVQTVDQALALVSGMICQAKKDDADAALPDVGKEMDLKAALTNATGNHLTVSSAILTRLEDIDSKKVFRSDVKVTMKNGRTFEVHLVHSPGESEQGNGTLWIIRSPNTGAAAGGPAIDPNNGAHKNDVLSISYSRTAAADGSPLMRFESTSAAIVNTVEPVDEAGRVNFGALPKEAQNSEIHKIKYVAFDGNTETNEGTLSYWMNPGGSYDESARGFLFNMANVDGHLTGCGTSGATASVSVRKAVGDPSDANTLKPVRYWHPFDKAQNNPNSNDTSNNIHPNKDARYDHSEGSAITEQCFKLNDAGVYAIDTAKTTHARGYEVIATAESKVLPPAPPPKKLDGNFKPD